MPGPRADPGALRSNHARGEWPPPHAPLHTTAPILRDPADPAESCATEQGRGGGGASGTPATGYGNKVPTAPVEPYDCH